MGLINATLNGNKVTDAKLTIPAWGVAYHDVTVDGQVTLSGKVTLQVADLTLACSVLAGGPAQGRSFFRLVAGAGGWGTSLPAKSYANDAGVKLSTVLNDAAAAVGETLDPTTFDQNARIGSYFTRPAGPACRLLEQISPGAWFVREDGKTCLGARPAATLQGPSTTTSQVDQARGTVTIASDSIASVLPGIVVSGFSAVDVEHEFGLKGGLRSKIWANQGTGASRRLAAWQAITEQLDPDRAFRGMYEYRVVTLEGNRLNLQPVRVSTGMPSLQRVAMRPGVAGCNPTELLGARVVVGFLNGDPTFPIVLGFEDPDGSGFSPSGLTVSAGGQAPTEHVATAEFVAIFVYNVFAAICAAVTPPTTQLTPALLKPLLSPAVLAALTELATAAPTGLPAQIAAAAAQLPLFGTGSPAYTSSPFNAAIAAAAAAKTSDVSGLFPAAGCADLKAG